MNWASCMATARGVCTGGTAVRTGLHGPPCDSRPRDSSGGGLLPLHQLGRLGHWRGWRGRHCRRLQGRQIPCLPLHVLLQGTRARPQPLLPADGARAASAGVHMYKCDAARRLCTSLIALGVSTCMQAE